MIKKALLVGIDHYDNKIGPLRGCINDVDALAEILSWNYLDNKNSDIKERNFHCKKLISNTEEKRSLTKSSITKEITRLFADTEPDMVLFYFSGHGFVDTTGGHLVTQDADDYDEGVSMNTILTLANDSPIKHIVIILDCCFSGSFGDFKFAGNSMALVRKGISIITASNEHQTAVEQKGRGLFTQVLCNGLAGESADLLGNVTISSIYNHASMFFGPWGQRPLFKASLSQDVLLRRVQPKIELPILRKLTAYFLHENHKIALDPSFEPTEEPRNTDNEIKFAHLQQFVQAGLVKPINAQHMYFAAINRKHCGLTPLGKLYWKMLNSERI